MVIRKTELRSHSLASLPCVNWRYSQLHHVWFCGFTISSLTIFRSQGEGICSHSAKHQVLAEMPPMQRSLSWTLLGSLLVTCVILSCFIFIIALVTNWYFLVYLSGLLFFGLSIFLSTPNKRGTTPFCSVQHRQHLAQRIQTGAQ